MTDESIVEGSYADFKLVKTRSVAQIVVEIPIELADDFIKKFGIPKYGEEAPVVVARLDPNNIDNNLPTRDSEVEKAIQKAGILCKEKQFGVFLRDMRGLTDVNPEDINSIANGVRNLLGIQSRTEFRINADALRAWQNLSSEYERGTGND